MGLGGQMQPTTRADATLMEALDFRYQSTGLHHCPARNQAGNS